MSQPAVHEHVVKPGDAAVDAAVADEPTSLVTRLINHLLTPGSSLSPVVWVLFDLIMVGFFLVWLMLIVAMPTNVHLWVFGLLGLGLALSTNWLMRLVFSAGLDYVSQSAAESAAGSEDRTTSPRKRD